MFCETDIDWGATAAWAQAILSAAAVFVAVALQDRSLAKRDQQALSAHRAAAVALAFMALHRIRGVISALVHENPAIEDGAVKLAARALTSADRHLAAFPVQSIGDGEGIKKFAQIRALLDLCAGECQKLENVWGSVKPEHQKSTISAVVFSLRQACGQIEGKISFLTNAFAITGFDTFPTEIAPEAEVDLEASFR